LNQTGDPLMAVAVEVPKTKDTKAASNENARVMFISSAPKLVRSIPGRFEMVASRPVMRRLAGDDPLQ